MKITICSSVEFAHEIKEVADKLTNFGHTVHIPTGAKMILSRELDLEKFKNDKEKYGDASLRRAIGSPIKRYFNKIKESDAILVLNLEKKGIPNYIGPNVFLEIGFAHVLDKKIFLYNDIPKNVNFQDEIQEINPSVINGDLFLIR